MFAYNHDSLVSQALSCGLVKDLLNILNSRLDNIPNASSCKAQVVHSTYNKLSSLLGALSLQSALLSLDSNLPLIGSEGLEGNAALSSVRGPGMF